MFDSIIKNLAKKNIDAIQVKTREEAIQKIEKIIPLKSSIGFGGSRSLEDIGILDVLRSGDYIVFDRTIFPKGTPEAFQMMLNSQHADFFLGSCNAITQEGQLIFGETNGNRISSIIYGPNKIILIVGKNKIVETMERGFERVQYVAEQIAKRLEKSIEDIRCYKLIIEKQRLPNRMFIVFVDEDLGT